MTVLDIPGYSWLLMPEGESGHILDISELLMPEGTLWQGVASLFFKV